MSRMEQQCRSSGLLKAEAQPNERAGPAARGHGKAALLLFLFLFGVYQINLSFLPGDDATPNVHLSLNLLERGTFAFHPEEAPFMFEWRVVESAEGAAGRVLSTVGWLPGSRAWPDSSGYEMEQLELVRERYFLVPSQREGEYVSTFGIGAGLFALPLVAGGKLFLNFEKYSDHLLWFLGKFAASIAVAGSAVLVFLIGARFVALRFAFLAALAYGLGTCVWSISSQTLWQHGPNELFLAWGCYFCLKPAPSRRDWALCGMLWGLAVLCRPTSGVVVMIMGLWLAIKNRGALLPYVAGGLPAAAALGIYHWHYFGDPWSFGQTERGQTIALEKTGTAELWQTPLWEGVAGLLISPSRGLFVYSPFLLLALLGIYKIWREREFAVMRPLTLCSLGLLLVAGKWFDWWGGWAYGYRPIVDAMPLVVLFLVPVLPWVMSKGWRAQLFALLLSWSVLVQFIGAFAYDLVSWNNLGGRNIDRPEHRQRLWSWRESQIVYYMLNFPEGKKMKERVAGRRESR